MDPLPLLTTEMTIVLAIVVLAVFLFVTELVRVDVAALLVMTLLGLLIYFPAFEGLLSPDILFSGLSSNAVVSIIAVMIIGGGLDKTGVMERVAWAILRYGGRTEKKIVSLVSGTVAVISSFMQNIGATALFLPVVAKISMKTGLPMSRLVMPMGFCAILGGTMTMVGSSPLIMLNDLLDNANKALPVSQQMEHLGLFAVAPVGIALVAAGLVYFLVFGHWLLPRGEKAHARGAGTVRYLRRIYGMDAAVREVEVPSGSPFVGKDIKMVQREFEVKIVASRYAGKVLVAPPIEAPIAAPATLAIIAPPKELRAFVNAGGLILRPKLREFRHLLARSIAGIAEIVIPPDSQLVGKSVRELRLRLTYGLTLLSIFRAGTTIREKMQDVPFEAGDTLVCHTRWDNLGRLEKDRDFVIVTTDYPREPQHPYKIALALTFFAISLGLVVFTDVLLPIALMTGAVGMIIFGVLTMDEAYRAVSWKTVFLLAGLLPLGHAVESSGTANYIAQHLLAWLGDVPAWTLQALVAVLGAVFSLVMSNVGATVLLVPLAINLALASGADPAMFALTVAVSTSNSFIIPTHQVNALIMGPGDYKVAHFIRAGTIMTGIFLVVSLIALNLAF
ncbi:MAG: SLC13 family permease [Gammaproteobacteria bacterium]|nr:SLC13 family permease [Gammaproteobacteria bacterium]NNF61773.1 SLC13 family permease [Gammaproteobacteria bacterium]NNM20440.1 SLC13 family permease [Gammaproteobacteria bacterium]